MVLFLTPQLSRMVDSADPDWLDALENIAAAAREGRHIVLGDRAILLGIIGNGHLGVRALSTYQSILNTLPEYGSLAERISRYVEVVTDSSLDQPGKAIQITYRAFASSAAIQETVLLAENILDARMFRIVGEVYARDQRMTGLKLNAEIRGGGGSTIVDAYRELQDRDGRFVLCCADSDRSAPSDGLGATARQLEEVDSSERRFSALLILSVRELENMISEAQLEELAESTPEYRPSLRFLGNLVASDACEVRSYLDFKRGISGREIWTKAGEPGSYLRSYARRLWQASEETHADCLDESECLFADGCRCFVFRGFGSRMLERVHAMLSTRSSQKVSEGLCPEVRSEWSRVGAETFAWCCSLAPRRTL